MNNPIKKLYPTTKFWFVLGIIMCAVFIPGYQFQYSVFIIIGIVAALGNVLKPYLLLFFKSIFIICLFIFIIQSVFIYHDQIIWQWHWLSVSATGVQTSLSMTSKIIAIGATLICFFQVTEVKQIAAAMQNAGWPKKFIFVILSTMQLIPQMTALTATITDAQKARGVETQGGLWQRLKSLVPMLGPVVLTAIEQNEERVLTLQSRAFSNQVRPTLMIPMQKTTVDKVVGWVIIVAFCLIFYVGVFK